jgi:hypothetical protein
MTEELRNSILLYAEILGVEEYKKARGFLAIYRKPESLEEYKRELIDRIIRINKEEL